MNFIKHNWEDYKKRLINFGYTKEQINEIKKIREGSDFEYMTKEQFDYLVSIGVLVRTRKLKKPRSLFTDGKQVLYLDSYFKRYNYCAFFAEENEE